MPRGLIPPARGAVVRRLAGVIALLLALVLGALGAPAGVAAATLTVTSGADAGGTCPGADCTLRQAIDDAADGDTIDFAPGVTAVILTTAQLTIAKSLTIDGGAAGVTVQRSTVGGTPAFRIFEITVGTVALTRLTITGGNMAGLGGGVAANGGSATLTAVTLSGNTAGNGGGMTVGVGSSATLTDTTLSGNTTTGVGGGGLIVFGTATVINTTISGNTAPINGGGVNVQPNSTATLTNVTVSGNTSGGLGGGVSNLGTVALNNVTLSDNSGSGGDSIATGNSNVTLTATIVTGDSTCSGSVNDGGHNLETGTSCGFTAPTSLSDTDPQLGPLADNGGPTLTHLPAAGSPAVDHIPAGGASCPAADQRGVPRPQGADCDSGAVERATAQVAVSGSAVFDDATATLTATITGGGQPVSAGGAVTFTYNGTDYPAITNALGVATTAAPLPPGTAPGTYPNAVTASYAGAGAYLAADGTGPLVVADPDCAARFADVDNANPACLAIFALANRDIIQGYATSPATYGPDDDVQRAQLAAFLVRGLHWEARPTGPRSFSDFDGLVADLRIASLIAANACDGAGNCVARGYGDGRFGPTDPVSHAQAITFIARAFALDPATAWAPGAPAPGTPAQHAGDIGTYTANAGAIPDAPTSQAGWDAPASRAWLAMVLWQALLATP